MKKNMRMIGFLVVSSLSLSNCTTLNMIKRDQDIIPYLVMMGPFAPAYIVVNEVAANVFENPSFENRRYDSDNHVFYQDYTPPKFNQPTKTWGGS